MSTYALSPRVLSGYTYKGFQYLPQNFNDGREALFHDVKRGDSLTTIDFDVHSELPLCVFHKFVDDTLLKELVQEEAKAEEKVNTAPKVSKSFSTKEERLEWVKTMLKSDSRWTIRGLLAIFSRQTVDETSSDATIEDNGVGFTGFDAEILTSFAKRVMEWEQETTHKYPTALSPRQIEVLQKRMPKYAQQLIKISGQKFDEKYPVVGKE
jgi:hypothetical protein